MTQVYVLLGSNIDPEASLCRAVTLLSERVAVRAVSAVFESVPVGHPEQPCFLNAIAVIDTALTPGRLKARILRPIEASLGRVRTADKDEARTIDLDIILYGEWSIICGGKRIPDRDLQERAHIARPMASVAPDLIHPETGETMASIAQRLETDAVRLRADITIAQAPAVGTEGD